MTTLEALKILRLRSFEDLEEQRVKLAYKKLMRVVHPDVGGSEEEAKLVNEAYSVAYGLCKFQKQLNLASVEHHCIVEFDTYRRIISGGIEEVIVNGQTIKVKRPDLHDYRVYLEVSIDLVVDGIYKTINTCIKRNLSDVYKVEYSIDKDASGKDQNVEIKAYGVNKSIILKSHIHIIRLKYDNNLTIELILIRRMVS